MDIDTSYLLNLSLFFDLRFLLPPYTIVYVGYCVISMEGVFSAKNLYRLESYCSIMMLIIPTRNGLCAFYRHMFINSLFYSYDIYSKRSLYAGIDYELFISVTVLSNAERLFVLYLVPISYVSIGCKVCVFCLEGNNYTISIIPFILAGSVDNTVAALINRNTPI